MVKLTIDGRTVEAREGQTILEAARTAGIEIPTLCHHPDLSPYGACRVCVVELSQNGRAWVETSCTRPVEEGLKVETRSARAEAARREMIGLAMSRVPQVPALQRLGKTVDLNEAPFPTDTPEEDCILCGLCVRACDERAQQHVLGFVDRGGSRHITSAFDVAESPVCDTCNQCVPYCPTGAITRLEAPRIGVKAHADAKRWMRIRQGVQYGLLALFAALMVLSYFAADFPLPVNLFSRLDPLHAASSMIAAREIIVNFWPSLLVVGLTLVFGRVWCGWACPLGALLELFGPRGRVAAWANSLRRLKYVILFTILALAVFGSMAFMWFDPITVLVRGIGGTLVPLIQQVAAVVAGEPFVLAQISLFVAVPLLFALGMNLVERRFWCRYICPLGATVGLLSKFSWLKRRVSQASCVGCGDCATLCTMGAISSANKFESDPAECIMCMDCAVPCRKLAITFERRMPMIQWHNEFDPGRRQALATLGAGGVAMGLIATGVGVRPSPAPLRPPGAQDEQAFLEKCVRCGQCYESCKTNALSPAVFEGGWDTVFTPVLQPHLGYCDYNCNNCGQVCPSGAIPPLSLDAKRRQFIGVAAVYQDICINCMVCKNNCPYEAFDETEITVKSGKKKPLPVVIADKCVGCGLCVYICPAPGAIEIEQGEQA